ncbi:MAG: hypothetical protein MUE46_20625 [Xanthomonadales bacterium]|nr:hypothetical protein [Xanthomonadales bacterium]
MHGLGGIYVIGALLCGAWLVPASALASSPAEQELRSAEWVRQGQLRQQAWRSAWLQGDVRQRWLVFSGHDGALVQLRELRELVRQPMEDAFIVRVALSTVQRQEGLPAAERDAIQAQLRAEIERLDADNAITWVEALPDPRVVTPERLQQVHALLQKVADSPRIDIGFVPLIRYFADAPVAPLTRGDAMVTAVALSAAIMPTFQPLAVWCREQPELRQVCESAVLNLSGNADTFLTRMIALSVLDRVATTPELRAEVAVWRAEGKDLQERLVAFPNPGQAEDAAVEAFAERWFRAYAEPGATEISVAAALSTTVP